jgi:hypothetical protein
MAKTSPALMDGSFLISTNSENFSETIGSLRAESKVRQSISGLHWLVDVTRGGHLLRE